MTRIRSIEITDNSIVVDGHDISDMVVSAKISVSYRGPTRVTIVAIPASVLYKGSAVVKGLPLDGIYRLRRWLSRKESAA